MQQNCSDLDRNGCSKASLNSVLKSLFFVVILLNYELRRDVSSILV